MLHRVGERVRQTGLKYTIGGDNRSDQALMIIANMLSISATVHKYASQILGSWRQQQLTKTRTPQSPVGPKSKGEMTEI